MLTNEENKHIAALARLELTADEFELFGGQLSGVLDYIGQLSEVNTDGIEPTAQVTGLTNVMNEDKIDDWNEAERQAALALAPELEAGQIKVRRVIKNGN